MQADETPLEDSLETAELCRRAVAGDVSAVEQLLWTHRARLFGFTRRKIGPDWQASIDPEDILQEAYVDVFRGITSFKYEHEDSFYRWTTRLIEHRFIDRVRMLRRKKRDITREVPQAGAHVSRHESFLANQLKDSLTPSKVLRRQDAVTALMACIAKLPDDWRTVVQRLHLNEEPLAVIAKDMDRTEDAVRRLSSRAVDRLAECLRSASRYLNSGE